MCMDFLGNKKEKFLFKIINKIKLKLQRIFFYILMISKHYQKKTTTYLTIIKNEEKE
jgi:hypothetical protein